MDKLELTNTGGLPFDQDILDFMQNSYTVFNELGWLAGNFAILTGCEVIGTTITNGIVFINGEVLPFKGGSLGNKVIIVEKVQKLVFEDGGNKNVKFTRYATFGGGVNSWSWTDFERPKNLQKLYKEVLVNYSTIVKNRKFQVDEDKTILDRLKKLEERVTNTVPLGLVAIWGRFKEDIPKGWREFVPLQHMAPVGYKKNYIGSHLGVGYAKLGDHIYLGGSFKKGEEYVSYTATGRVVEFIEFVGF